MFGQTRSEERRATEDNYRLSQKKKGGAEVGDKGTIWLDQVRVSSVKDRLGSSYSSVKECV